MTMDEKSEQDMIDAVRKVFAHLPASVLAHLISELVNGDQVTTEQMRELLVNYALEIRGNSSSPIEMLRLISFYNGNRSASQSRQGEWHE